MSKSNILVINAITLLLRLLRGSRNYDKMFLIYNFRKFQYLWLMIIKRIIYYELCA